MILKTYIAIFFSVVFFGKFLVVDSKVLIALFDADEVVYVNPFCQKQNVKIKKSNAQNIAVAEDSEGFVFLMDAFCNSPLKFEIFNWEARLISEETKKYADYSPSFPESARERFYPPPQV
jgi:hypothetical protein